MPPVIPITPKRRTPRTTPTPPAPPLAPPAPPATPRRRPARRVSAILFWVAVGTLVALLVLMLAGYGIAPVKFTGAQFLNGLREQVQPAQPAPKPVHQHRHPVVPKPPTTPAPAPTPPAASPAPVLAPVTICCLTPESAPPALSAPTPPALPAPLSGTCSEADNYYCGTPPPITPQSTPAASFQPQGRTVNVLSGNTFQLNILSGNGSGNGGARYGYGSTYGWTPGHVARVCEQRSSGIICFDRWIAHPHPSY